MRSLAAAVLAAVLAAAPPPAHAQPSEIRAEYRVTNQGVLIGRVDEHFVRTGDAYTVRSVTRSEGVLKVLLDEQITLESSGKVTPEGLKPMQFSERRAKDSRRDVSAAFDWERGVIHSRHRGANADLALPPGTQDRISMMYQFMNVKPRPGPMVMPMSNGRKVEEYTYRLVDEARVATPAGEFDTLHYQRVVSSPTDRRAEVWLARDRFNFPVRVVYDDPRGLRLEQTLVALQAR